MQTESLIYIILAGLIALLLALFQYLYKSKRVTKTNMLLALLRFVTLFTLFLLLINPKFETQLYFDEKPSLIVAVDNSESVKYLGRDRQTKEFVNLLKKNQQLNARFNIEYFTFGKAIQPLDTLTFDEKRTNPAQLFDQFSQVYTHTLAPMVLVTDGNQTYGNAYEYAAYNYKQAIFPMVLGDTTSHVDLKIDQLNVNRYVYLKNKFPVEIIAQYTGLEEVASQLIIYSGTQVVFSQHLSFGPDQSSQVINLSLPAETPGVHSYKAEIKPLDNEKNTINNIKHFAVEVIDKKTHVAIISDIVHPDLGALKKAIESNEQRQASIVEPSEFLKAPFDFQQAILYQPNENFKGVYDQLEALSLNTLTILGTKTNWAEFNRLQPDIKQTITNQYEDFQAELNPNYNVFIVDNLNFNDFPPLQTEFGAATITRSADIILYKTVNGISLSEPLLFTFEDQQKRAAVLNGEGIWRWRAYSYLEEKSFDGFDGFFGKIIQYLDSSQKRSRLTATYESFYNGNDNLVVTAQFFNKNYEFDKTANLEITLKNKEDQASQTFPFIVRNTFYEVDLSGLAAGDYEFTVTVADEPLRTTGQFKVLDYNIEQQFLNANVPKLQKIAHSSKGNLYFIDDPQPLIENLLDDERFVTVQKSTKKVVPLVALKFLLVVLAVSLSVEWFIRKYKGLI